VLEPIAGINFLAYGTNKYGVNVACGDIDGDGIDEIITGAGPGDIFGPHVRAFNYDGGELTPISDVSFSAYDVDEFGVNVACGDIDGDGIDEIVTGPGPGEEYLAEIRAWNYDGVALERVEGLDILAYDEEYGYGARVALGPIAVDSADGPPPLDGSAKTGAKAQKGEAAAASSVARLSLD
jgi:fibronectin-binding autotransporter adhesin